MSHQTQKGLDFSVGFVVEQIRPQLLGSPCWIIHLPWGQDEPNS